MMRAALLIAAVLGAGCSSNGALAFAVAMNSIPAPARHPTPEVLAVEGPAAVGRLDGAYHVALDLKYVADHFVTGVHVQVLETGREEVTDIAPPHARSGVVKVRTEVRAPKDARAFTLRVTLIDARGVEGTSVIRKFTTT